MSSEFLKFSEEWPIGSIVNFKVIRTGDRFKGTVNHFRPRPRAEGAELGIKNVTVWRADGICERLDKYVCYLREIKDDQDNSGDEGSSSKPVEGKDGVKSP